MDSKILVFIRPLFGKISSLGSFTFELSYHLLEDRYDCLYGLSSLSLRLRVSLLPGLKFLLHLAELLG